MELGMLHWFESPVNAPQGEIIREHLELMVKAEELGFDSVWPAEHHFSEYALMGAPQVTLAAVAARTSRIRLGSGVVVLPFHHPVRIAEDFAFLDQMSGGRVALGVGRGHQPLEFAGFEVEPANARAMFDEAVQLVRRLWTEECVSYAGRHYRVQNLTVQPRPLQQPHPPIYMACISPESFEHCGRLGCHVLYSAAFGLTPAQARLGIAKFRYGRVESGLEAARGRTACLLMIYPGRSMEQARADFRGPVTWYYRTFSRHIAPMVGALPGYADYARARDFAAVVDFDALVDTPSLVCGDVEHCTEKLIALGREFGFDELLCWTRMGGLASAKVIAAMELLSGEILPAVRRSLSK